MPRTSLLLTLVLCVSASLVARASTREEILPAGTILHCTMDEPNFSSKTAQAGDPVLCHLGSVPAFGHSVFPRGAMLSGHLQDSKDPGHFFGKGWLDLEFDRIILPGAEVLPLSAKIIAAPHLKTDKEGKIRGGGHPKRDAVEWMIPVLWPVKILTLPARGPYPALKGESRLTMRLMEDVTVPVAASSRASVPAPPWVEPGSYTPPDYGLLRPVSTAIPAALPEVHTADLVERSEPAPATQAAGTRPAARPAPEEQPAVVVLKGGAALVATDYWVQGSQLHCISEAGEQKLFPLDSLDLYQTVRLNRQRNVEFVLHTKELIEQ
jgi:hypothetical protein